MGRFSKFVSAETKAKSSTIVVNKYEIAENALEIMSKICSPKNEDDFGQYFYELDEILWPDKGETFKKFVGTDNFLTFRDYCNGIKTALASHENTNATQIVVAGAFSSGKSTFLNTILGHTGLLPTDTDAASIVNTFIYCSKNIKEVSVKGVNLKNVLVQLDTDVLQCIQHSSKSNVYLASVLEKLIIEYPANELTKGLSFIDTPGYNNSDEKNAFNGRTDKETAMQALKEGDVLFWLVEIGDGSIVSTGEEMINHFLDHNKDGKVVIIFNKADKKNSAEMRKIVESTAQKFNIASQDSRFIDVIAYSSSDTKIFYSFKGYSLEQVFEKVRCCSTGYSEVRKIMNDVKLFFDYNIEYHAEEHTKWAKKLLEKKKEKNDWADLLDNLEKIQKDDIEKLRMIILDTYSEVKAAADRTYNVASNFYNNIENCLNNGLFCYGSAKWGDGDDYETAVKRTHSCVNSFMNELNNAHKHRFYNEERRKDAFEKIKIRHKEALDSYQTEYDEIRSNIDDYQLNAEIEKEYIEKWSDYKDRIVNALEKGIAKANAAKEKTQAPKAGKEYDQPLDIFQAILGNDYSLFENCFTKGVSLYDFNPEGYSPLTYAVKTGQNDMVQYFIEHNADLRAYDKRGYNAIQTAVENNYKDICQILLTYDKSLSNTRSEKDEDLMTIARKNTFENWLSKNI